MTSAKSATIGTIEKGEIEGVEIETAICGTEIGPIVEIEITGTRGVERDRRTTETKTEIDTGSRGIPMMKKKSKCYNVFFRIVIFL